MLSDLFIQEVRLKAERERDENHYPYCLPAIKNLGRLQIKAPVTFFVGENGMGKSTLLEAIAVNFGFNAEGGTRNFNFATRASHSDLHRALTVSKGLRPKNGYFLRAESFYNFATEVERLDEAPSYSPPLPRLIDSYGGMSLHEQSHGESFMAVMKSRFSGGGLYLLDEPESALSPTSQMTLLALMKARTDENAQFIIATHAPILMAFPGATIYHFSESGIAETAYKNTPHYQLTRRFLEAPEKMLDILLADED